MSYSKITVPIRGGSDGDATHRPKPHLNLSAVISPTGYLDKIAALWMKDRGDALPGERYTLDRLPAGYAVFERTRANNPNHVDKWLYGHPSHKSFDSPNRFYPHFKHLMDSNGNNTQCPCTVCNGKGGAILPMGNSSARRSSLAGSSSSGSSLLPKMKSDTLPKRQPKQFHPGMDTSHVDEEGTPDVYRNLIDKLKRHGELDEPITEPMSLDWRAEQECLPRLKKKLTEHKQFIPRAGEVVLFVRELPRGVIISCERKTGAFKLYNETKGIFLGFPTWEAGLVGQTPLEAIALDDVADEQEKVTSVSSSGIRVEPIPDPNGEDKSLSKRHKYLPLHHTRPFVFWKEFLVQIPEKQWHKTIKHALTLMSTFSLLEKYRFKGQWAGASIYCHGIYVGSELHVVGDTVRLLPKEHEHGGCTVTLVIKSIRLELDNLDKASDDDYDEGRPYNSSIFMYGTGYTTESEQSLEDWIPLGEQSKVNMEYYQPLYPLHPPNKELKVPFSRILGRLYDSDAMTLWLPSPLDEEGHISLRDLDQGRKGVLEARAYSRASDKRIISELGSTWFWGDTRAQALDLQTVNGLETSKYDTERDPKDWRKQIKVMEEADQVHQTTEHSSGALQKNLNLRAFIAAPQQRLDLPVRSGGVEHSEERSRANSGSGTSTGNSFVSGLKRRASKVIDSKPDEGMGEQIGGVETDSNNRKKSKVAVTVRNLEDV